MKRQTKNTFKEILKQSAETNLKRLMTKARTANRIAKNVETGTSRRGAYRVKTNTLSFLKQSFPERVSVQSDERYGNMFVLVTVKETRFGLHAPSAVFKRTIDTETLFVIS